MTARPDVFLRRVFDNFGWKFCIALASIYIGLKGFTYQVVTTATLPFFKNLGVTGERYQSFNTIAFIPWSQKSSFGFFSDIVPLYGYHKRSYMALTTIVGMISLFLLGTIPFTSSFAPLAAILLLPVHTQMAVVDLLTEGKYASLMVEKPETGASLVTYVAALISLGSLFGSIVVGPLADRINPKYIFLLVVPFAAQIAIPVIYGWFPEQQLELSERKIRFDKIRRYPDLLKLSIPMTIGPTLVALAAFNGPEIQSITSTIVSVVLAALGSKWLPSQIKAINLYLFLINVLYFSLSGALDYFFTADNSCVPGGPQFSLTYYITYVQIISCLTTFLGVILFQKFLSKATFRFAFWTTTFLKIGASLFDYIIVKRYNITWGIPDKTFFIMGDAILLQAVDMLQFMSSTVLVSKVCPQGIESSVYALLASYQNLGADVARALGVGLMKFTNIQTVEPCNFDGLPNAILIGHVLIPTLAFPLVFWLIPDAHMTDDLIGLESSYFHDNETLDEDTLQDQIPLLS